MKLTATLGSRHRRIAAGRLGTDSELTR